MKFLTLTPELEEKFNQYITTWYENDETIVPWSTDVNKHGGYTQMLKMHEEAINNIQEDFVPARTYVLVDEQEIKGAVNIRYGLNHFLKKRGGHIGYGVGPNHRERGYATKLLKFALNDLKRREFQEALITCDEENQASAKVILKNGGKEIESFLEDDKKVIRRFIVELGTFGQER